MRKYYKLLLPLALAVLAVIAGCKAAECPACVCECGKEAADIPVVIDPFESYAVRERIAVDARDDSYFYNGADVYFYSDNLSDEQIIGAMLKPCRSIEATVYDLVRKYGRETSICVLPEGPQTIPYISDVCS